jgi:hypothetical protein
VKRTLAAGKGSGVRHLLNITAEGSKPVADPEDDKLWLSLESKHTLLEFNFARTWQQVRSPGAACSIPFVMHVPPLLLTVTVSGSGQRHEHPVKGPKVAHGVVATENIILRFLRNRVKKQPLLLPLLLIALLRVRLLHLTRQWSKACLHCKGRTCLCFWSPWETKLWVCLLHNSDADRKHLLHSQSTQAVVLTKGGKGG